MLCRTWLVRGGLVQRSNTRRASSGKVGPYKFFEDMYPKCPPVPRFATYEEQMGSVTVKSLEVSQKEQMTESAKLHYLHEWKKDKTGLTPPPEFGWPEDWGPEPGADGHSTWYTKNRMYMSNEEKCKYDLRTGVPVEKNSMRHQEMPYEKRLKGAYHNLEERDPQYFDPRQRKYWSEHSYEDQRDTVAKARDDYMQEWLDKPDVNKENVAKRIGDYNGTAKLNQIKSVQRRPEWELAPLPEYD